MIGIIDYGMGNLRSVAKAVERVGGRARIISAPAELDDCEKLILPGVGAFADAMSNLGRLGLVEPIRSAIDSGRPFLGICLGLQLLYTTGMEGGPVAGLDVLPGTVERFEFSGVPAGAQLAVPHMGWNAIRWERQCPLLAGLEQGCFVYFVHSFHPVPETDAFDATRTDYGYEFTSGIWRDNLFAFQFHPEKSQTVGLKMMANFVGL